MAKKTVVLIGAGSIGQAIVRRIGAGKHVVLADLRMEFAQAAAKTMEDAGFETSVTTADLSSRESILALIEHARQDGDNHDLPVFLLVPSETLPGKTFRPLTGTHDSFVQTRHCPKKCALSGV